MAYGDITILGTPLEFDTGNAENKFTAALSGTRIVIVWENSATVKNVQTFEFNRSTGAITANSSPLNFYSTNFSWGTDTLTPSIVVLDSTHFAVFWTGSGNDGYMRTFQVNAGTGQVTAWGNEVEYDTTNGQWPSGVLMANNGTNARILNAWSGSGTDGFACIFTVTMSTGAIAVTGTPFEFNTTDGLYISLAFISATKAIVSYYSNGDLRSRVLDINTSTWAVTAAGSDFNVSSIGFTTVSSIEYQAGSPAVSVLAYVDSNSQDLNLRALSMNTGTWALSNLGSATLISATASIPIGKRMVLRIDDTHYVVWFNVSNGSSGIIATYAIDLSTGGLTNLDSETFEASGGVYCSAVDMGDGLYINAWTGPSADGYVGAFQIDLTSGFTPSPMMHMMEISGGLI